MKCLLYAKPCVKWQKSLSEDVSEQLRKKESWTMTGFIRGMAVVNILRETSHKP